MCRIILHIYAANVWVRFVVDRICLALAAARSDVCAMLERTLASVVHPTSFSGAHVDFHWRRRHRRRWSPSWTRQSTGCSSSSASARTAPNTRIERTTDERNGGDGHNGNDDDDDTDRYAYGAQTHEQRRAHTHTLTHTLLCWLYGLYRPCTLACMRTYTHSKLISIHTQTLARSHGQPYRYRARVSVCRSA